MTVFELRDVASLIRRYLGQGVLRGACRRL